MVSMVHLVCIVHMVDMVHIVYMIGMVGIVHMVYMVNNLPQRSGSYGLRVSG